MVSELEKQRRLNIERNQKLIREFQLKEAAVKVQGEQPAAQPAKPAKRRRFDVPEVPKRVRRLRKHGLGEESSEVKSEIPEKPEEKGPVRGDLRDVLEGGDWDVFRGSAFQGSRGVLGETTYRSVFQKVVPERVTSLVFHPSQQRLVLAGDKVGGFGVWNAGTDDLTSFRFHTRNISAIVAPFEQPEHVYTASQDGSVRCLDLKAQASVESAFSESGVTDLAVDAHTLFFSRLNGEFIRHDLRTKKATSLVLSEKKIGGFSLHPAKPHLVATASLDRTLKVWDLRKAAPKDSDAYLCGTYTSRLSISASSWNRKGQIVCNGYDNTINIFDLSKVPTYSEEELVPSVKLNHNCQTGRWVSILKARWQARPGDDKEKFVIGNMQRFADVFGADGEPLAQFGAEDMTAVPAVAQFHPTENWLCGGNASGKVHVWVPEEDEEASE